MKILNKFVLLILMSLLISCSGEKKVSVVKEKSIDTQMIEAFEEGYKELENGDVLFAAKKFNEAELLYPQSVWAPRAALMSAYGFFSKGYYNDAINDLERFILKYKNHPQLDYAYYLLALCHYDQIIDEKKI